ncbi:MAG: TetR/AcrR family transcriptional regulator, partial [Planctomycetota bacterium]
AMGIQRGSLYQAFGDKKALFLAALERYLAVGRAAAEETIASAESPAAGLRTWLEAAMASGPERKGCFAVNATVELSSHDPDVAQVTADHWRQLETLLAETLERAREAGEIRGDVEPLDAARLLVASLAGAQVLARQKARGRGSPAVLASVLGTLLADDDR